jgi:hypothetical protein
MVSKWRARFVEYRLVGLPDATRPGAPRTIDDARVDAVIDKTSGPAIVPPSRAGTKLRPGRPSVSKSGEPPARLAGNRG